MGFGHMIGSVYRNCCSTSRTLALHSMQVKVPNRSSGRTSDVRVTVPEIESSLPTLSVCSERMPDTIDTL